MLTAKAKLVAEKVIAEESVRRRHLVVALSGSHAYGFPSPDSDLDIKASHAAPVAEVLGLSSPQQGHDRLEVIDGIEIDYTSNEIAAVLNGVISGNGNYIERILGELILASSAEHKELIPLVQAALCRKVHRHYRGFGRSQAAAFNASESPTAKKLLYVLRTALTGTHLLLSGELLVDLRKTAPRYGWDDAEELIAAKRAGENVSLSSDVVASWKPRIERLFATLDAAWEKSPLPIETQNRDDLEDWLIRTRANELGGR